MLESQNDVCTTDQTIVSSRVTRSQTVARVTERFIIRWNVTLQHFSLQSPVRSRQSSFDICREMFMKKRRAAELLAEMHRPPTPPSSDQESDGDTEIKLPKLSSSKEEDKMLAKVRAGGEMIIMSPALHYLLPAPG